MNTENMNQNTEVEPTATPADQTGGQKTFTQDDVNRIVQDRLAKDRAKTSEEMSKREQELAQREFRLNSRQKLIDRGYPESLLDALNCSSEEAFNKALETIDGLMNERMALKKDAEKQAELEKGRARMITQPLNSSRMPHGDPIRKAMNLN